MLDQLAALESDVLSLDWRIRLDRASKELGEAKAIQGNLDPVALFAPLPELKIKVRELLKRTGTRPGHIFNLGHGILPETPEENVKAVVQKVQLGEVDAGFVYRTDVTAAVASKLTILDIPDPFNVIAQYPIAIVKSSANSAAAQSFVDYVLSMAAQDILAKYHFIAVNP